MNGVSIYIMEARIGQDEAARRFQRNEPPRHYRPSYDSAPTAAAYLTEGECQTLRRRIDRYLIECDARRRREIGQRTSELAAGAAS